METLQFKDNLFFLIKQKEFLIVSIESVEMFLQFCVSVFWLRSIRDLAPQLGVKPAPPALEGRVSTIAP